MEVQREMDSQLGTKLSKQDEKNGVFFTEIGEEALVILKKVISDFHKIDELVATERGLEIEKKHVECITQLLFVFFRRSSE